MVEKDTVLWPNAQVKINTMKGFVVLNGNPMNKIYTTACHVPDDTIVYAIGDIHGYADILSEMHRLIYQDLDKHGAGQAHIIYLGDYIDRGPQSKQVLDLLIRVEEGDDTIQRSYLLGNHEEGLLEFLRDPESQFGSMWMDWGGVSTMKSYGIDVQHTALSYQEMESLSKILKEKMGHAHFSFLSELFLYEKVGNYMFVHAGIDPEKPVEKQSKKDFTLMREPFLSWPAPLNPIVVHGHTITDQPEILPHRIGIDTGLYQGGCLTAAVFEKNTVRFLQADHS